MKKVSMSGCAFQDGLYFDFKIWNEDLYILAADEMDWQLLMVTAGDWTNCRAISIHTFEKRSRQLFAKIKLFWKGAASGSQVGQVNFNIVKAKSLI